MPAIHDYREALIAFARELPEEEAMADEPQEAAIVLTAEQIDSDGTSWIEVMPTASEARNGRWFFTVTAEDLGTLQSFIQANPDRIPIDYDHSGSDNGGSTRAAGWFTDSEMTGATSSMCVNALC